MLEGGYEGLTAPCQAKRELSQAILPQATLRPWLMAHQGTDMTSIPRRHLGIRRRPLQGILERVPQGIPSSMARPPGTQVRLPPCMVVAASLRQSMCSSSSPTDQAQMTAAQPA